MGDKLRVRLGEESEAKKLLESIRVLRVKSAVFIEDIVLTERTKDLLQVKATVSRTKSSLLDESRAGVQEHLEIELVERIVPRTAARPDGLEVVELLMTAYMSAEQGRTLEFRPPGLDTFVPAVALGTWKP